MSQPEVYRVTAGERTFVAVAPSFKRALTVIFTELGATTSDDLPKPFSMERVHAPVAMFVYDGVPEDLRAPGSTTRRPDDNRVHRAELRANESWDAAAVATQAAAKLNDQLVLADRVIDEAREMAGMLRSMTSAAHMLEALAAYDRSRG